MINKPRVASGLAVVLITTLLASSVLFADGFRNPPEGARAIGAFGGHRAFADDANANIHNPANMVDLEQPMVQYNVTAGYGRTTFEKTGISEQTDNPFFAIPGFSAAMPFKEGKYAAGLSFYVPYGRSVEWKDTGYFAQNNFSYAGSMTVADLTPNFAMRLTDSLSFGVGADLYYGAVKQWTYPPPYGGLLKSKLTADGQAIGWNAAMTWKMTEKQRLAATYRSPFTIKYHGDNDYSGLINNTSDVDAEIEYPSILGLAYGIELTDTLRAEVNGEWLNFSQYENLTINDSASATPQTYPQNLKDTWTTGVGLGWNFKPQWTLRSGFMYLKNPTPNYTYGPLSPDTDQGVVSVGLGYETGHHAIDLGYAYGLFFNGRNVSGNQYAPIDGSYDYTVHLLSLSYGYKF
jgi:long-subunit fatty acid transport protein